MHRPTATPRRRTLTILYSDPPTLTILYSYTQADGNAAEAYVLRAVALMYSSDLDQARKHLREALRLDPDDPETQRALKRVRNLEAHMSTAKSAYNGRDFAGAKQAYSAALEAAGAPQHAPPSTRPRCARPPGRWSRPRAVKARRRGWRARRK